jgi:hypothetical protein
MNVIVTDFKENEDGSANISFECDEEFTKAALDHYLKFLLYAAVDPDNNEYAIAEPKEDTEE